MFDDFHQHRGVVPGQPVVAVGEGAVAQGDLGLLRFGQAADADAGAFQLGQGGLQPGDAGDARLFGQGGQQAALAAAQVGHGGGAQVFQRLDHGLDPGLGQVQRLFQLGLPGRLRRAFGRRFLVGGGQPFHGLLQQGRAFGQVAADDGFLVGVVVQPALAGAEQLVDFVFGHPVVLFAVQGGQQDAELAQGFLEGAGAAQGEGGVGAVAPLGEGRIQRGMVDFDLVVQGFERGGAGICPPCRSGWRAGGFPGGWG